ncbi:uncharacterized protein G6M90_00g093390 [Metarhizium brunneum]|uniref:CFEM domain-containing protein n=1 Tax=Metarhizium brunneum TaxID=500148 RepID=A0A7D5V596_9HYPO
MRVPFQGSWGFLTLLVAAVMRVSVAQAQSPGFAALMQLPQCAINCMNTPGFNLSACNVDDLPCLCHLLSSDAGKSVSTCVVTDCSVKDSLAARNLTQQACGPEPRNQSTTYTTVAVVFTILSSLAVIQRFAVKLWFPHISIDLDDWLVLATALCQLSSAVLGVAGGVPNGVGRDIWTLSYRQITNFGVCLYIYAILYFANVATLKLAFLFFYLRIFPSMLIRRLLWVTIGFTIVYGITFILTSVFQCKPISYYWVHWDGEHQGTCANISEIAWANGAISIAIDIWMIAIPLSQLWRLKLDWKKKVGVFIMLSVGFLVTIVSIIRLQEIITHAIDDPNATWAIMNLAVWSTVEINVGIICACMPSMRLLFDLVFRATSPRLAASATNEANVHNSGRLFSRGRGLGVTSHSVFEPYFAPLSRQTGVITVQRTYNIEVETLNENLEEAQLVYMTNLSNDKQKHAEG